MGSIDTMNNSSAQLIVVCGPSGVGKGTLTSMLFEKHGEAFGFSVSHTTRSARPGEVDGKHYHFVTKDEFLKDQGAGNMLEFAHVHSNMYGTSKKAVQAVIDSGKSCILDIDVQGAESIYKIKDELGFAVVFVFFMPPCDASLEKRLRGRGTETEEKIQLRLKNAKEEVVRAQKGNVFPKEHYIVNDDKQKAFELFRDLVLTAREEHTGQTTQTESEQ